MCIICTWLLFAFRSYLRLENQRVGQSSQFQQKERNEVNLNENLLFFCLFPCFSWDVGEQSVAGTQTRKPARFHGWSEESIQTSDNREGQQREQFFPFQAFCFCHQEIGSIQTSDERERYKMSITCFQISSLLNNFAWCRHGRILTIQLFKTKAKKEEKSW